MNQDFDSVSLPLPPTVERFGEIYTLTWADRNIQMVIDRFDTDRHQNVSAEITVTVLDAPKGENYITRGRAGLLSTFKTIIDDGVDFGGEINDRQDWKVMLKQMSSAVLDDYRMGEPLINLAEMSPVGKKPYILTPFIYEGCPTVIYGRGGVGKSLFCLYLAVLLQTGHSENRIRAKKINVIYLDYEADPDESKYRADFISRGMGIDPSLVAIHYRHCSNPLREEIDSLQRYIRQVDADCIVIDSAIPACGDALDSGMVAKFFNALRSLSNSEKQIASLLIGHTTKAQDTTGGPFGSVVWRNGPRSVWEFRADQQRNMNRIDVQLVHQKVNLDPLLAPIGFRINWGEGEITFESLDARRHAVFGAEAPLADRVEVLMEDRGGMSSDALGVALGAQIGDIEDILSLDMRFSENGANWELSAI